MKVKITLLFIAVICTVNVSSQQVPYQLYQQDLEATDVDNALFNDKMLNLFFANEVGTAFGGSNNLSLQRFYASLDANDKSISVGFNYDSRPNNKLKRLKYIHSGSVKLKSSNKFATVYDFGKDEPFQKDNIGITYKFSIIGRGILNFKNTDGRDRKKLILKNRQKLYKEYNTAVPNAEALYVEMVEKEVKYIKSNKLYNFQWNHWYSAEIYIPLGRRTYKTTSDIANPLEDQRFLDASLSLSGNTMWAFSKGFSIFVKGLLNIKNNNNILVDDISSRAFQTTQTGANNITVITNTDNGFITDYNEFVTPSILIEPAFFLKTGIGYFGVSPSIEKNFGTYDGLNWKLGLPISLNDNEGKPKVNFEIQWKEVQTLNSSVHLIGISTNFLFGDLIN